MERADYGASVRPGSNGESGKLRFHKLARRLFIVFLRLTNGKEAGDYKQSPKKGRVGFGEACPLLWLAGKEGDGPFGAKL